MTLKPNWREIFRKAWSIRLGILAGLFSGAEVVLPLFMNEIPRNMFAALSFVAVMGALVARLIAQPKADL